MTDIQFPIIRLGRENFQVIVDTILYAKESVTAACYKYTNDFYIHQQTDGGNIVITFEPKENKETTEEIVKQFCNELIDQQIRYYTNQQFGQIRDMIVEEAFKPVNK